MATETLQRGLKQRHLTMIAIGGVIGAGLFVGTGVVIEKAGPGAFITYALCGVLIIMVMQMLGEMAVARPSTGSFTEYAREAMGPWAGFSVAWLYWYFWVIIVGFEAVAGAKIIQYWIPNAPLWAMSLLLMLLMTATNLYSVKAFGEFEYWFAGIKVAAILVFLITVSMFVLGLWPGSSLDFSNLTAHGGFFPHGKTVLLAGMVTAVFSMVGAEIATIAGAESDDPERAVTKATRSVVWRILLFFVGSVFLLAVILPWNDPNLAASPYVSAFEKLGIPFVAHIMNAVVLTSVLSCLNSGLYTASRMLFVLAGQREAPSAVLRVNKRGVPTYAILMSTVVGFACVIMAFTSPDTIFPFLLNSSGAVILFAYILIACSQLVLRRRRDRDGTVLRFKMWGFPYLTIATIVAMVAILIGMFFNEDTVSQITLGLVSWAFLLVVFGVMSWYRKRAGGNALASENPEPIPAHDVLILATDDLGADQLIEELRAIGATRPMGRAVVVVPANPVDAGTTSLTVNAAELREETREVSRERLDRYRRILEQAGIPVTPVLGNISTYRALSEAVAEHHPDSVLVVSNPDIDSMLLPRDTVARARAELSIPVYEVQGVPGTPPAPHHEVDVEAQMP